MATEPAVSRTSSSSNEKYALAVDIGGTKIAAAMVSRRGKILAHITEAVDASSKSGPIRQISRIARELAQTSQVSQVFAAAGVAVPGLVRPSGTVWAPNLKGWEHMPLRTRLERALAIRFAIESDRNAAVLGETWMGTARGKSDAVVLIIGTGIGAGIIAGGHIVRGAHELSGCAGWLVVNESYVNEARHLGQLEAFTAGPGIARSAAKLIEGGAQGLLREYSTNITTREVAEAAREGDAEALAIFEQAGKMMGRAVANIVSMFDPEVVIIGGGMAATSDLFMPSLRSSMKEWAQPLASRQVRVKVSQLKGDANLLGAARIAWSVAAQGQRPSRTHKSS
jgi:glucokinase